MFEIFNKKNNKIQKSGKRGVDEQGKYNETLEHIRGNAATGEQVHSVRGYQTDKPMTFEEMKVHWDEMNLEAKEWLDKNPGQAANFITSQDTNGNEILRIVPAKDLVFSGSNLVAVYDEKTGNQIVGRDNIIREIQRRRKQSDEWIRNGKLENAFDETHHTDDGWTSNVRFTSYPNKLHPKEVEAETDQLIRLATEKRKKQLGIKDSQGFSGGISEVSTDDDNSNKKPRTEEKESTTFMDIDQSETWKGLPTNDELKRVSKDELNNLINRAKSELKRRDEEKESQDSNASNYEISTQELKNIVSKAQNRLQTFGSSISNNDTPNNSNVGGVLAVVGVVSVFAIGGVALVKNKLGKKK